MMGTHREVAYSICLVGRQTCLLRNQQGILNTGGLTVTGKSDKSN